MLCVLQVSYCWTLTADGRSADPRSTSPSFSTRSSWWRCSTKSTRARFTDSEMSSRVSIATPSSLLSGFVHLLRRYAACRLQWFSQFCSPFIRKISLAAHRGSATMEILKEYFQKKIPLVYSSVQALRPLPPPHPPPRVLRSLKHSLIGRFRRITKLLPYVFCSFGLYR